MILTESKPLGEIISKIDKKSNVFIIGCNVCAAKMGTGGEPEIKALTDALTELGYNVGGSILPTAACSIRSYESLVERNENIQNADVVLVMSCGSGSSVVATVLDIPVVCTTNTLSLGGLSKGDIHTRICIMCGDCTSSIYGGLCPTAECPKSQLNGPCGGSKDGKCEVGNKDCIWELIEKRFSGQENLPFEHYITHKDHRND
ncbi:MAG: hypothetical protein GX362_04165 [Methanosarcinaceae archaeon]|nr:hypothetical protein [Methanosarcinaceae archaeon]